MSREGAPELATELWVSIVVRKIHQLNMRAEQKRTEMRVVRRQILVQAKSRDDAPIIIAE